MIRNFLVTGDQHGNFNNLIWNGWKYLTRPFEVIVSDMTAFYVKGTYYELFNCWYIKLPNK